MIANALQNPLVLDLLKIAFVLAFILQVVPIMVWVERKVCAYIQDRIGPNRAALFGTIRLGGMIHSATDALKMIFKEDIRPTKSNRFFYLVAPFLVVTPALLAAAVIPFADALQPPPGSILPNTTIPVQIAQLDVGMLYIFAIAGLTVFGILLAGWSSNNKYSLLGGLRSAAQLVSYEISLTLSAVTMMVIYGTPRLEEIVAQQGGAIWHWGVFRGPVTGLIALVVFTVAVFAESNRLPFDLPEGESELVAGYHTEYSGFKFGMFMMAEYVHMIVSSAVIATIFFGGWQIPFASTTFLRDQSIQVASALVAIHAVLFAVLAAILWRRFLRGPRLWRDRRDAEPMIWAVLTSLLAIAGLVFVGLRLPHHLDPLAGQLVVALAQFMVFTAKIGFFLFLFVWVRWTLPRFRFDQVMRLGWKMLMPVALVNIVLTGGLLLLWRPS